MPFRGGTNSADSDRPVSSDSARALARAARSSRTSMCSRWPRPSGLQREPEKSLAVLGRSGSMGRWSDRDVPSTRGARPERSVAGGTSPGHL